MALSQQSERFSIITCCYNAAPYIREAIESALAQTHAAFELIVVDDGSTDDTLEIVRSIRDPRLQVLEGAHGGVSRARNLGLERATGDFTCFLDADDRWLPRKLEVEAELFRSEPAVGALFSNFERFNERGTFPLAQFAFYPELATLSTRPAVLGRGRVILGDAFAQLISFGQLPGWGGATCFRSEVIRGLRLSQELSVCQDLDLSFRAFARTSVAYLSEALVQVRRHGRNNSGDADRMPVAIAQALAVLAREQLAPAHRRALNRRLARQHIGLAVAAAKRGELRQAYGQFDAAFLPGAPMLSLAKHLMLSPAYLSRSWLGSARSARG